MRLYIDPGTGSMLFTVLIGILGAGFYSLRMLFIKLRYKIGGKAHIENKKIPFAIFSDDKRYWQIFEPVIREMDKRGIDVVYLTQSEDDAAFSAGFEHMKVEYIGKDNKAFSKLNFLKATILLSTTPGLDVYQWKRSKEVDYYVHLPHAPGKITLYRMFGIDYYDSLLLSDDFQVADIRALEELRNLPKKEIEMVGMPYMDEMAKRLEKLGPAPEHERTILLAPSWGKSAMFSKYGDKIIDDLIKSGYHLIIRPHPQSFASEKELMESLMAKYPENEKLEWNRDSDNFEVLRRSDILISDFSGVMFDFSLIFDKPIIYTKPDFDASLYDHWWIDRPLWTIDSLPYLGKELTDENLEKLPELIDSLIEDLQYAEGRRYAKEKTWLHQGEGAKRTVDYLVRKYEELCAKEGGEK